MVEMSETWEHENAIELLLIADERVGVDVVIPPEELKEFADNFNRVCAPSDGDLERDPPLEFREVGFRVYEQCDDDQNGPVYAVAFQALKSEAADLLRWGDVELVDGTGKTKALVHKLSHELKGTE